MDIGNLWNSLYTSQLIGTQMYGLQSDPFQTYGSYGDVWQTSPWQYGLQTGTLYGDTIQTWQNAGFMDTLNNALTKYMETASKGDVEEIKSAVEKTDGTMDVSTHEGSVLQLGYDKALVYLPQDQKIMIVKMSGDSQIAETKDSSVSRSAKGTGTENTRVQSADEKGIFVNQRRARASAAYRRTQTARQQERIARFLN